MLAMSRRHRPVVRDCLLLLLLLPTLTIAATACHAVGNLSARATDEWNRTYPLAGDGEVQISNTNGKIEVEGVEGSSVEVRAERTARAATESLAREMLPRIVISEEAGPSLVKVATQAVSGLIIGARFEVNYHVRVPKAALVRVRTVNGEIAAESLTGRLIANTVNGAVGGRLLTGGVEARTVNGPLEIELRAVGADPVDLRTTNGPVHLILPQDAKANVTAGCVNGVIDMSGLMLDLMGEQSKRRVRGRLNGGGTPVDLNTVNGKIEVSAR